MTATLLAGSWDGGLFVNDAQGFREELAGRVVRSLAPCGKGEVLGIVDSRSLQRRSAAGAWTELATSEAELSCCVAQDDFIYVGTDDARILQLTPNATLRQLTDFQGVTGREQWYAGTAIVDGRVVGPPLGIRSMTISCDGEALLANVHVGGIPRSTDHGASWHPTIAIDADVHQVCAHPTRPECIIAASAVGLCVSFDGGASWTIESEGLHALHCSAVAFLGNDILVSASEDPFSEKGAVYRRAIDGKEPLRPLDGGMPRWTEGRVDTGCMAMRDSTAGLVDAGGNLYVSQDAGRTWSRASRQIPTPSCLLML
jgi:BNR/Asp-box repeat